MGLAGPRSRGVGPAVRDVTLTPLLWVPGLDGGAPKPCLQVRAGASLDLLAQLGFLDQLHDRCDKLLQVVWDGICDLVQLWPGFLAEGRGLEAWERKGIPSETEGPRAALAWRDPLSYLSLEGGARSNCTGMWLRTPRFQPALGGEWGLGVTAEGLGARTPGFYPTLPQASDKALGHWDWQTGSAPWFVKANI